MVYLFLSYVLTAAWQDFKEKSIPVWVYIVFGSAAVVGKGSYYLTGGSGVFEYMLQCICSMGIGFFLLAVSRFSEGKVGEGDGWFFMISGLYLSFRENLYLLTAGLFFCSLWGIGVMAAAIYQKTPAEVWKKRSLPFLPFLIPAVVWAIFL